MLPKLLVAPYGMWKINALITLQFFIFLAHVCDKNYVTLNPPNACQEHNEHHRVLLLGVIIQREWSLMPHSRSFQRRSSQPITWLILTNKTVKENTQTKHTSTKQTMQNTAKRNYPGLVAFYDTRLGNEVGLFYDASEPTSILTYVLHESWITGFLS